MAKSSHSGEKRRRELKLQERREEKASRRAERIEAKKLRAEGGADAEDPNVESAAAPDSEAEESDPPAAE